MYRFLPALPTTLILVAASCLSLFSLHSHSQGVQTANQVGNTPAQFDVSYGGAASYKVPLNVPVGAAGLQPAISLNYNSQYGNGVMGLGWQLATGLARIEECYKRMTSQRIYCLNGEELVPIDTGHYRTEIDSGILVETVSASQFKLHYENGTIKTLTRQLSSPNVYLEVSHRQRGGASYSVNWSVNTTNREALVNTITYQGNTIRFIYQSRKDIRKAYWLGAPRNRTRRLQTVVAEVEGQQYRQYHVIYNYDKVSGFSKVSHIQECDANGDCLRPLSFTWSGSGSRGLANSKIRLSGRAYGMADLNNDGREDFVSTPLTHAAERLDQSLTVYADINGDGIDDSIYQHLRHFRDNERKATVYYQLNGSSHPLALTAKTNQGNYTLNTGEFNGDGIADILLDDQLYLGGPTGRVGARASIPAIPKYLSSYDGRQVTCHQMIVGDFNGDRLTDLLYINSCILKILHNTS
ncbi:MAG: SpvB/TcaC N-terminal domain-containing protein [Pseudomonadota bacterium]